jgi:sugar phosphate isomerase/epimerase
VKLAVSSLAWPAADDAAVGELLRAEGIPGVELAPSKVWPRAPRVPPGDAEAYAARWQSGGCEIVAFQAILFGRPELNIFGTANELISLQQHLVAMGALAARCGAHVLVLGAPGNRRRGDRSMSAAVRLAAQALRPAAEGLAAHGVTLCIEPNPARYGCDFVTSAAEAAVLAEAVDHPNFGVHLDTAALAMSGETTSAALAPIMRHVRHVHLSEVDLAPVGTSNTVPHAELGEALRAAGWTGWLSIEMKVEDTGKWREAIPRAADVARRHYLG